MPDVVNSGFVVRDLMVRSLDIDSKEVTWAVADTLDDVIGNYSLEVLRSESPSGPWDAVSPVFEDRYIFVDRRIPLGDRFAMLYYMIRVTDKRSGAVRDFGPAAQGPDPDLVAQTIRRLEMTYFTQVIGRAVWLFKKRAFGPRCRSCWDSTLQKRTKDRCLDCFSTGILRGYHHPIEIWMQIDPSSKTQQNNAQQIAQFTSAGARTSFYPNISPGDVVVELENKRWRVQSVTTSERLRAPIKQELVMRELEEKDLEFKLPIKLDKALRDVHPSPVRMYENATDRHASIQNRTADVFAGFMTYPEWQKGGR